MGLTPGPGDTDPGQKSGKQIFNTKDTNHTNYIFTTHVNHQCLNRVFNIKIHRIYMPAVPVVQRLNIHPATTGISPQSPFKK